MTRAKFWLKFSSSWFKQAESFKFSERGEAVLLLLLVDVELAKSFKNLELAVLELAELGQLGLFELAELDGLEEEVVVEVAVVTTSPCSLTVPESTCPFCSSGMAFSSRILAGPIGIL